SVNYAVADSSHTIATGVVSFGPGETTKTFAVPTTGDFNVNGDTLPFLTLSNPVNGAVLNPLLSAATLRVLDDDSSFAFSQPTYVVSEDVKKATITITR